MSNSQNLTTTEERALALLGNGIPATVVAASLGVSDSRISQLLSDENFAARVSTLRYENLQKHNERDASYDKLEDRLLDQLEQAIPMMHRPMEIARVLQTVNMAKRRGAATPEAIHEKQEVITLVMPTQIINKFTTNIHNQVVQAGTQELLTIQSGSLERIRNDVISAGNSGNKEAIASSQ